MATNYDEALNNLAFLSKRFQGLLELGNDIKAAKQLLNQKQDLERSLVDLSKEVETEKAKVSKAKADLKKVEADWASKQAAAEDNLKVAAAELADVKAKVTGVGKERQALMAQAQKDYEFVVAQANAYAEDTARISAAKEAEASQRLSVITDEINRLRSKF